MPQAQSSSEFDAYTCSAAISACQKGGKCEKALQLFGAMAQRMLEANVMTCSAAVGACELGSEWAKADSNMRQCDGPGAQGRARRKAMRTREG